MANAFTVFFVASLMTCTGILGSSLISDNICPCLFLLCILPGTNAFRDGFITVSRLRCRLPCHWIRR